MKPDTFGSTLSVQFLPQHFGVPRLSYCQSSQNSPIHKPYHDFEYGFPIHDDNLLFERLILEINQAGLSWLTILKKKDSFFRAYSGFEIKKVARYGDKQINRLLNDSGIIRNRLKINAAIFNAKRIVQLQKEHGSFESWLDQQHPLPINQWVKVFKAEFKFVGGEICNEFLMSTGYLKGAHDEECPIYKRVLKQKPRWFTNPN